MFEQYGPAQLVGTTLPLRSDGTGKAAIQCKKATFDFFKFENLPSPQPENPGSVQGGYQLSFAGGKNRKVARGGFRIAYEGWPGHKRPKMARIQIQSDWLNDTYLVIHNHLIAQGVPYLYLCNANGNLLNLRGFFNPV